MRRSTKRTLSVLAFRIRTCAIQPCLHDEIVYGLGVDDVSETRGIEVTRPGVDSDILQINGGFDRGESYVT